ncbi:MAG: STAS domain-containing protein [Pseudomonadales bacterium]|nr:STAS domain-containing protein [Pseudomonadales bacterium]
MPVDSTLSSDGKTLTINISGRFDFEVVQEFRDSYSDHKDIDYIIDMRATEHMDSSALGMLLNMRKSLGDNTKVSIINCRPQIKKILTISRFDKKFDIE